MVPKLKLVSEVVVGRLPPYLPACPRAVRQVPVGEHAKSLDQADRGEWRRERLRPTDPSEQVPCKCQQVTAVGHHLSVNKQVPGPAGRTAAPSITATQERGVP